MSGHLKRDSVVGNLLRNPVTGHLVNECASTASVEMVFDSTTTPFDPDNWTRTFAAVNYSGNLPAPFAPGDYRFGFLGQVTQIAHVFSPDDTTRLDVYLRFTIVGGSPRFLRCEVLLVTEGGDPYVDGYNVIGTPNWVGSISDIELTEAAQTLEWSGYVLNTLFDPDHVFVLTARLALVGALP